MLFRLMVYLSGIVLCSLGLTFIIIYLNLLNMGYSFIDYVHFIYRKIECLSLLIGILLIYLSLHRKGKK